MGQVVLTFIFRTFQILAQNVLCKQERFLVLYLSNKQQPLNFDLYMLLVWGLCFLVFFFVWFIYLFVFTTICTRLTRPELSGLVAIEGQSHFPASSNHVSRG